MSLEPRPAPVIIITGTPGTGKSTHAQILADESPIPLQHINVGEWVKEKGLYEDFDEEWQSYTVDEDKVRTLCFAVRLQFNGKRSCWMNLNRSWPMGASSLIGTLVRSSLSGGQISSLFCGVTIQNYGND